jgi:hypothetical protein
MPAVKLTPLRRSPLCRTPLRRSPPRQAGHRGPRTGCGAAHQARFVSYQAKTGTADFAWLADTENASMRGCVLR